MLTMPLTLVEGARPSYQLHAPRTQHPATTHDSVTDANDATDVTDAASSALIGAFHLFHHFWRQWFLPLLPLPLLPLLRSPFLLLASHLSLLRRFHLAGTGSRRRYPGSLVATVE